MMSGILEEMTIDEVREFDPEVVVLGVGSTEPHGPSLPYGTDFFQCDGLCRRAVTKANAIGGRVLMYPTLPIGNNVNFKAWPFACRVRVRTLMNLVLDVIEQLEADGIRKIVIVNGHGGNTDALHAALREHMERHTPTPGSTRAFVCMAGGMASKEATSAIENPSPHGGESEVSRVLYLRPDLVHTDELTDQPVGVPFVKSIAEGKVHWVKPWHLNVPLSGGGDTRKATAEKGERLIESGSDGLAGFLAELSKAPWNPNFPYDEDWPSS